jgi:hypothetical protein
VGNADLFRNSTEPGTSPFIHQFIRRGTPKYLPDDVRHKLANLLGVSEELLRGRDLHAQPIEITRENAHLHGNARAAVGGTDLDDMWTIWNTATLKERQLIVDLARQVVGRIRKS